ncbi:MAG: outer membrane protein transport protein [Candidatus Aminicenantes bacterium]|nr:outer membrane protein transport protein [Candidatus Aminicenantes bacterium]
MRRALIISAVFFVCVPALFAGGWNNTLIGCRAIALGGAFCAVADDPCAVFYNPAGLVLQENRFHLALDGFYVWPTHEFTTVNGNIIQSRYNTSLPQFFATCRVNDRLTVGFGMYTPYAGGGVDWEKSDLGFPLKTVMGIVSFTPSLSYRLGPTLSVGININWYRAVFSIDTEVEPYGPLSSEEQGSALSGGLGLLFRPSEKIALGVSLRAPARMKLTGKTHMQYDIYRLSLNSDTAFNLPWDMDIGAAFRVSERLLVSAGAQYSMWSALDKVEKAVRDVPLTGDIRLDEPMGFRDILVLRCGAEYAFPQGLALRAGVGLDRFASPVEALTPTNIDVDKLTLLGGIGYRAGRMKIDFAYVYGIGEEREKEVLVMGLPFSEKYNLNVRVVGLGLTFVF